MHVLWQREKQRYRARALQRVCKHEKGLHVSARAERHDEYPPADDVGHIFGGTQTHTRGQADAAPATNLICNNL